MLPLNGAAIRFLADEKLKTDGNVDRFVERRMELAQQCAQLSAQVDGLQEQLKAAQAHTSSLEEKHNHAREALEHFRQASREQRDREARQHEQQLHYLQGELRTSSEALGAKHTELRSVLQEKADALAQLTGVRAEKRQLDELLRELGPVAQRLAAQSQVADDLRTQASLATSQHERLLARASELSQRNLELERQIAAAHASALAQDQLVKDVLARIGASAPNAAITFSAAQRP